MGKYTVVEQDANKQGGKYGCMTDNSDIYHV